MRNIPWTNNPHQADHCKHFLSTQRTVHANELEYFVFRTRVRVCNTGIFRVDVHCLRGNIPTAPLVICERKGRRQDTHAHETLFTP